jgi:hypothetical protein
MPPRISCPRRGVAVRERERVFAFTRAAEPGITPARGKDQRGEGGGMNTGRVTAERTATIERSRPPSITTLKLKARLRPRPSTSQKSNRTPARALR